MPDLSKFDPDSHDLVSELLLGMRLKGVQYRRIHVAPPFGLRFQNPPECGVFYFVARGSMLLRDGSDAGGGALMELKAGDAVLMPRGGEHALLSAPGVSCTSLADLDATRICESIAAINAMHGGRLEKGEISDDVLIFCGCMELDLGGMQPLVHTMPDRDAGQHLLAQYPEIQPILDAMERETRQRKAGFAGILSRLADVVAAQIVRGWVENGCGQGSGLVQALRDPRLSLAMAAMHRAPGENWTVERAGARIRQLTLGVCRALSKRHRHDAAALPHRTAHAAGRAMDRARPRADRGGVLPARLRLAGRLQPRLQAHHRAAAGGVARPGRGLGRLRGRFRPGFASRFRLAPLLRAPAFPSRQRDAPRRRLPGRMLTTR